MDHFEGQINDVKQIEILDYFVLFWVSKKQIFITTTIFFLIGLIYAIFSTTWYSANVKIIPTTSNKSSLLGQYSSLAAAAGFNISDDPQEKYALYPEIIESNFILDRVLKHKFNSNNFDYPVDLFEFWGESIDTSTAASKHILYENTKKKLRADYIESNIEKKTNMLTLTVNVPRDAVLAADLANYITSQLDIYNKHFRKYKARDQRLFIEKSILDSKNQLNRAEKEFQIFQEENKDYSSPEKKLSYDRLYSELNIQREIYLELRKQFELAKIDEVKETETLDILEKAVIPIKKYKPKRLVIVLFFTIVGLIFSAALIALNHLWGKIHHPLMAKIKERK